MAVVSILKSLSGARADERGAGGTLDRIRILDQFEQAGIGWIWASDAEGRLIYLSEGASGALGRSAEDLVGQPLVSLFETDPDNPDERSDRPFNFQLNARSKVTI